MPGSSGIAAARQHRQGMLDGLVRVAGKCSLALDARYQLVTRYIAHARRPWVEASRVQGSGSAESMEFVYGATPSCLRLVREGVHASKQWRQTAGVLPLGMPQGLRRGRTSMGRPSDHRGVLTVQELKNGPAAMRALVLDATRRASVCVAPSPDVAPVAPVGYRGYTTQEGLERLMSQAIAARRRG